MPELFQMRKHNYITGLNDFINYIDQIYKVSELTILEVGSWTGQSACMFAERFKNVICVDAWDQEILEDGLQQYDIKEVEKEFDNNISKYQNITKVKGKSIDVAKDFDNIDVVYIDADHSYEGFKKDLQAWSGKAKFILSGHDVNYDGVKQALTEVYKVVQTFQDSSWSIFVNGNNRR